MVQQKNPHNAFDFKHSKHSEDLHDEKIAKITNGPLKEYLEDEIDTAKDMLWEHKKEAYNEFMDRNVLIGKKKVQAATEQRVNMFCPRWYQDFSIDQVNSLMMLQFSMHKDSEEMVTGRTQRTLLAIGIVSTFFTLTPNVIRELQDSSNCNVIDFLREVYKLLTGNYFEEEEYKPSYDCNERIILSAIAFLTLPEAIVELHNRLPPVKTPKIPSKPVPSKLSAIQKMPSPYQEELFGRPNWIDYYHALQHWREKVDLIAIPKAILPPAQCILINYTKTNGISDDNNEVKKRPNTSDKEELNSSKRTKQTHNAPVNENERIFTDTRANNREKNTPTDRFTKATADRKKDKITSKEREIMSPEQTYYTDIQQDITGKSTTPDTGKLMAIAPVPDENKLFDFTINGISEKPGPIDYKICGVLQPPQENKKSWLGEKHAHYIISGAPDDPPTCPVTYEMTGIANVTPTNSNERFFAVLKIGDGPKKIYPNGRKNLSPHWQEWLQNVDEEFRKVEREANKMIKSIEATTKLVFPGPTCDSCCSCRQTRKSYLKAKETKAPYFVIDTVIEDKNKNKYIVGSMAMHSPAPTPPESTVNLLEIIASEDVLKKNLVINGVTTETGETQYFITGLKEDIVRVPARVVERPPPRPPRNVPACVCAVQKIFKEGLEAKLSHDHIPWTKEEGLCFGKKYRPDKYPAYSCKQYPGDKSCRRNPFLLDIKKLKRRMEREKQKKLRALSPPEERKMYSIADVQPCGDEHGMRVCGGPWDAVHTLTAEELAEKERLRKEILRGPPCGTKPRRAVCEGPFGERIPEKRQQIEIEVELPGEFDEELDEEEEVEEEKQKEPPVEKKEKEKKRDKTCYMSPESIAGRKIVAVKKEEKFIPDPTYPGYDDPWNIYRTAPSKMQSETDFKSLLKLSSPASRPAVSEETRGTDESGKEDRNLSLKEDTAKSDTKREHARASSKDLKQRSFVRSKSTEKSGKLRKPMEKKSVQEIFRKDSKKQVRSKDALSPVGRKKGSSLKISRSKKSAATISGGRRKVDETDSNAKDLKSLKAAKSKDSAIVKQSVSPFKKIEKSVKHKSTQGKVHSLQREASDRYVCKDKKTERTGPSRIKIGEIGIDKKVSSHRKKFNKGSKHESVGSRASAADNAYAEGRIQKSSGKRVSAKGRGLKKDKLFGAKRRSTKRDRKKDVRINQFGDEPEVTPMEKIKQLKSKLMSSELYPHNVSPVEVPQDPPAKCTVEYEDKEEIIEPDTMEEETDENLPSKGPCGWRTKSEQKLPIKKTLAYLAEPNYPEEMIPVRPGGRACVCRENRNKKKILMYNIGGLIGGKKDDADDANMKKLLKRKKDKEKQMQVIDGIFYYTPPPSPRKSDEYVPEYDVYDSPYDMCLTKRKLPELKYLEQHSGPKSLVETSMKNIDPCGCNEYVDTFSVQDKNEKEEEKEAMQEMDKKRRELMDAKLPKDRWSLALKDVGLIDYFTRCRDSLPCWLKCAKFNKVGCPLRYKKLKVKRPVCECKYERKVLEHKEEKVKWKERQKRLKSLKKAPFVNVTDISQPIVEDTKLMISGVKRIPRDDEYIDDVKYCVTGVAKNSIQLPPKQVVGGVQMSTPIVTPEQSVQEIPCVCLHRHWSPLSIPAGPLPKPEEIMLAEKKRRQEAAERAYAEIYAPQEIYDSHQSHSCKDPCNVDTDASDEDLEEFNKISKGVRKNVTTSKLAANKPRNPKETKQQLKSNANYNKNEKNFGKITKSLENIKTKGESTLELTKNIENNTMQNRPATAKTFYERNAGMEGSKYAEKYEFGNKGIYNDNQLVSVPVESSTKHTKSYDEEVTETDLMTLVKHELTKMAEEGFLFAKLPNCFQVPQLRYWLMYREGFVCSESDKQNMMRQTIITWNTIGFKLPNCTPPPLGMTEQQLRNLTYDDAEKMKKMIAKKKAIFHSKLRKGRVLYGRSMWNTMEYGKFPSTSFKRAYFTYMPGKEADGHVFKPWRPSEVRQVV